MHTIVIALDHHSPLIKEANNILTTRHGCNITTYNDNYHVQFQVLYVHVHHIHDIHVLCVRGK